jgi:hypothetical protein
MKPYLIVFFTILSIGCKNNSHTTQRKNPDTLTIDISQTIQGKSSEIQTKSLDTLRIGKNVYYLDTIPEATYYSLKNMSVFDPQTESQDSVHIKIRKGSIVVISENNKRIIYKDDSIVGESRAIYEYKNTIKKYNLIHVKGHFWEWTADFLISLKDGKETVLWGNPNFSPSGKYIICSSADLEAMEMNNGIQLFSNSQGNLEIIFEKLIDNWEPIETKWETDSTILIKRATLDKDYNKTYDYLRMKLK